MLSSHGLVMQTPSAFHGRAFDYFTVGYYGLSPPEIDVFTPIRAKIILSQYPVLIGVQLKKTASVTV